VSAPVCIAAGRRYSPRRRKARYRPLVVPRSLSASASAPRATALPPWRARPSSGRCCSSRLSLRLRRRAGSSDGLPDCRIHVCRFKKAVRSFVRRRRRREAYLQTGKRSKVRSLLRLPVLKVSEPPRFFPQWRLTQRALILRPCLQSHCRECRAPLMPFTR
jgi:hypothetical protein